MVRALLDSGAQGCLVSSWLVKRLRLDMELHRNNICGVGGQRVDSVLGSVSLSFSSRLHPGFSHRIRAVVLRNILGHHPQVSLPPEVVHLTSGLQLADSSFHLPGPVDLLLGADVLGLFKPDRATLLQPGGLVAVPTDLGSVIMGPAYSFATQASSDLTVQMGLSLSDSLQRFWEVEEPPPASRSRPEDIECEAFFLANTGRFASGRFFTRLPFLAPRPRLGDSRQMAEKRLLSMERRMRRDAEFRKKYIEFLQEYEDLGHMSASQFDWEKHEHNFVPHHAVFKNGKIRVVFDGSAPTSSGVSLNDCLLSGPKLQIDISDILTGFRRHQVVFVADIKMMFRQVVIDPEDRRFQLILWRKDPASPMIVYELNTNTYGLKSSPFIAIRSLLHLADREQLNFPRAAAILSSDVYVDDVCTGAQSEEEALVLRDELVGILQAGGYELRKWLSNSPALLQDLPTEHQQEPHLFQNLDNPDSIAILGVQYRPVQDIFTYCVEEPDLMKKWTKRSVLATVARVFDPNGWLTPVVFWAKCFLQDLWLSGLDWDTPLIGDLLSHWLRFYSTLPDIQLVSLPRPILPPGRYRASLHGFCDASEHGYAAVVYLRTVDSKRSVRVSLIVGKSKVAPVRTKLTIPKLELSGAALLTRLLNHIVSTLGQWVQFDAVTAWSDSQIVLCWLQASVHALETFVANRVSQIQASTAPLVWRHVPGSLNPADCASRGLLAPKLLNHPLWWGPAWLSSAEGSWPNSVVESVDPLPGLKVFTVERVPDSLPDFLLNRFSTLDKLIGVTCWMKRFLYNARTPSQPRSSSVLSPEERQDALLSCVRLVQTQSFGKEIGLLRSGHGKLRGSLARLNLFLDDVGLLRVGGRLRNAELPYEARHPLLLPKSGHFVELLIRDRHVKNCHAGLNGLLACLQRDFWVLSARRAARSVIFKCIPCYRLKGTLTQPQMGDLPPDRVRPARPFSKVGLDFAGPFLVKTSSVRNARQVKAYLCVFVCLFSKAVHLELVSSLSTEAFIACLSRFVSRRGLPHLVRSDCGTNFKGADRYLKEVLQFLTTNHTYIESELSKQGVVWIFDPPGYPSWGGIFEAAVKVAKIHLRRVIGLTVLTFEEIQTVFCKVEAVLNSRPLCPISSDPNDLEALTPGHFLIGCPLTSLPEYPFVNVPANRLSRFELLQQISQSFHRRWSSEYLHLLQQRVRWTDKTNPPRVGDLVLLKEPILPPLQWRMGRIVKLFPGSDGIPRVAEVLVGDSVLKRAVATLSRLPVE